MRGSERFTFHISFALFLLFLTGKIGYTQDLRLFSIAGPSTGCQLSAAENVSIIIINVGPTLNSATFDATYILNGGSPVTENILLPPVFNNGSLITYTFNTPADLSVPGSYTFDAYINLASDVNRNNDSIFNYIISSDPFSVGGTLSGSATVCSGTNNGYLVLSGFTGNITGWEQSPDGSSWSPLSNTNDSLQYVNLTSTKYYRAVVKSGTCPQALSTVAIISVDQPSVAGLISGIDSICPGTGGTLNISGNVGSVTSWASSTDNGINWSSVSNTTNSYNYPALSSNTLFASVVKNGVCPADSSFFTVSLRSPSVSGTASGNASVCSGNNSGTISLSGFTGNITRWERSTNGGSSWTTVPATTSSINYLNLTTTTLYRAVVFNCSPEAISNSVTITVNPAPVPGTLSGGTTVCSGSNSGTINLTGSTGTVTWESSVDGVNWVSESGSGTSLPYSGLTANKFFRAKVSSSACSDVYSNSVEIEVDPATFAGVISDDTTVCIISNSGQITLSQYTGNILQWESSSDEGSTWTIIPNTNPGNPFSNLSDTVLFRVLVKSGVCLSGYSDTTAVNVAGVAMSGTVIAPDSVCYGQPAGLELAGYQGASITWEVSYSDSNSWEVLQGSADTNSIPELVTNAYFRAIVANGACGTDTSLNSFTSVVQVTANAGNDSTVSEGSVITLSGSGNGNFEWTPAAGLSSATIAQPAFTGDATTTFTLVVTGLFQCRDTDQVIITVDKESVLKINNFISANGDGINDNWVIEGIDKYSSYVLVFNSNGHKIFEAENYLNTWDATYNSKKIPDGTYYYVVGLTDLTGTFTQYKGNLTVVSK